MIYTTTYDSPLGVITLAGDSQSLIGLWIQDQKYFMATIKSRVEANPGLPVFAKVKEWLDAYFAGENPAAAHLPLAPVGSDFRQAVWAVLREIPYGQCTTYGEIARQVAAGMHRKSMSCQAVGGAVGHNAISIIIPCHRVVGSDGSLTGFAGGIDKKIKLLELEGVDMANYFVPCKGTAL